MSKRALFLHGTNGSPNDHWWSWLRQEFEKSGYEVWAPLLPDNDRPNEQTYWDFLASSQWDFADNVLVGHSSGATSVLNLLARPTFPKAKAAVLVGAFLNEDLTSKSPDFEQVGQFAGLFPPDGFDWEAIKQKAEQFYFVHADNDPYCAYDDAVEAARALNGELIIMPGAGHISESPVVTELPQLADILKRDSLL